MRFLVDQPLPPGLAELLRELGHEAVHADDHPAATDSDLAIWNLAAQNRSVIVTKDEDFRRLLETKPDDVRVLWVRLGNCSNRALFEHMRQVWPRVQLQFTEGRTLVEVR